MAFLRKARVFALACTRDPDGGSDNLPTVIMEAMAAGLPVVSTRVRDTGNDRGWVTGRVLAEHDVAGLAAALEEVLRTSRWPGAMGRWGGGGGENVRDGRNYTGTEAAAGAEGRVWRG